MEVAAAVGTAIVSGAQATAVYATTLAVAAGEAVGLSTVAAVSAANFAVAAAGNLLMSAAVSVFMTPGVGNAGSSLEWRADIDAGIPFAFGRVAAAGVIAHRLTYDATNRYQTLWCTLAAAGPYRSVISASFDDEVTTFDSNGKANTGEHEGFMWFQSTLGTQPETYLPSPTGAGAGIAAPGWTSDHKASGRLAYALTMFENSKGNEFPRGEAKPLIVFEGKYGWDPRLDSTWPGGSGSCRLLTPSTWVWIENPILAGLNWAIGMWEGDSGSGTYGVPYACSLIGGIGATLAGLDVASFVNAANVADDNGWTIAAYPTTKDDAWQVLSAMLQAGGAYPSRVAGKISCVTRGEAQSSVVTVTAADTVGPVEIALMQSQLERRNTITPRYWSEEHRWELTPTAPVTNSAWVTEDRNAERGVAVDFPYVPAKDQAAQLGYYELADAREGITGTVTFKPHLRQVAPGDVFTFAEPDFILDGVAVKCLSRTIDPMTGLVQITFRQETAAKHAAAMAQTGTTAGAVDPETPPGVFVDPPTTFSVTGAAPDVDVAWRNPILVTFDGTKIWRNTTATFGTATLIATQYGASGGFEAFTDPAPGTGTFYYWVQAFDVDANVSAAVGPASVTL